MNTYVTDNIRRLMELNDVNNITLAKELGINKSTVTKWFTSNSTPRGETVQKIATYFCVPVEILYKKEPSLDQYRPKIKALHEVAAGCGRIGNTAEDYKQNEGQLARVVGDSMYPTLHDGDVVRFIEDSDVSPSDFALVRIDGEAMTVKHVEWTGEGLWVRAENKDVFEDRFYTVKEIATIPVQVVGKAVEIVSRKL